MFSHSSSMNSGGFLLSPSSIQNFPAPVLAKTEITIVHQLAYLAIQMLITRLWKYTLGLTDTVTVLSQLGAYEVLTHWHPHYLD
jgi:hypothetical protein